MLRTAKKITKYLIIAALHPGRAKQAIYLARKRQLTNRSRRRSYLKWFAGNQLSQVELEQQKEDSKNFKHRPLISVLLPTYNTPIELLSDCIDSIINQTYDNWELCIADDASTHEDTKKIIKEYGDKYENIKYVLSKDNGHIAVATNEALALAKGEYISLMDHDDLLLPDALYETVKIVNDHPSADLIYSDEDKIEDNKCHVEPFFKPDWSPDFLLSCNVITHFATIRHTLMKKVGGFRNGSEGAQDWDLFLRITELTDEVYHIPKIIYSWRKTANSTAQASKSKPYAYINQKKVLRDALERRKQPAVVEPHIYMGFWRVKYEIIGSPYISIIIPSKDNYKYLNRCLESIFEETNYPNFEVIVVDTGSKDPQVLSYYDKLQKGIDKLKVVNWHSKSGFNFSAACNAGAKEAKGEYLVFLNNDTKVLDGHWLRDMLEHAQRPEIGAVGCKLFFPDRTIQHAGVVLSKRDVAFHPFYGLNEKTDIFSNIYINNIRNVAAVTAACMMVSKKKFNEIGGFDTNLRVTYNDVDLCLKLLDKGYLNLYTPYTRLVHYESKSVGNITTEKRDKSEWQEAFDIMQRRWDKYLQRDPYYNDNFVQHGPGYNLE
jgi:glycosyltransferase involved in cell wall biosynthesis